MAFVVGCLLVIRIIECWPGPAADAQTPPCSCLHTRGRLTSKRVSGTLEREQQWPGQCCDNLPRNEQKFKRNIGYMQKTKAYYCTGKTAIAMATHKESLPNLKCCCRVAKYVFRMERMTSKNIRYTSKIWRFTIIIPAPLSS